MRVLAIMAAAALCAPGLITAQSLQKEVVHLEANLAGDNENPGVDTPTSGDVDIRMEFSGRFDDDSVLEDVGEAFANGFNTVVDFFSGDDDPDSDPPGDIENVERVTIRMRADLQSLQGQTFTGGHIHRGGAGDNGPVVVDFEVGELTPAGADAMVSRTVALTAEMDIETAFDIVANPGNFYVNLHTSANPSGEIRGQLETSADTEISRELEELREDVEAIRMMVADIQSGVSELASEERLEQLNRIDENVANVGRRVGLNTQSEQVVGSAR